MCSQSNRCICISSWTGVPNKLKVACECKYYALGLVLVISIKRALEPFSKRHTSVLHSCTNEPNASNIATWRAWQMALSLFNGVVKSGTEDPISTRRWTRLSNIPISTQSDVHTLALWSCGKTWQLTLSSDHLSKRGAGLLQGWAHSETATGELPPPPSPSLFTYASWEFTVTLLTIVPDTERAAGVIITQQIGQFPHQLWSSRMEIWWAGKC